MHQNAKFILFTGLSGAGKSTIAEAFLNHLQSINIHATILDGDVLRKGLSQDLGFSIEDRVENMRRVGHLGQILVNSNVWTLAAFISPFENERQKIKSIIGKERYVEVHVSTSLEVCMQRDTKGLYAKAKAGKIENMTGIDSPYDIPIAPDFIFDTESLSVEEIVQALSTILE